MKPMILALFCVLVLYGCATSRNVGFKALSDPPNVTIEVNGIVMCDKTPCDFYMRCSERWVGLMNSPTGRLPVSGKYEVSAIPELGSPSKLYSDKKLIDPCQVPPGSSTPTVRFNLHLEPTAPTVPIDIK